MSVLGRETAVVSLGSSCQTAHQVKQNAQLLSDLAGEALVPRRFPFDWLICPIVSMTGWIASEDPFPGDIGELTPHSQEGTFHWRRRELFFWHDFKIKGKSELASTFHPTREKYTNLFTLFRDLKTVRNLLFIVSNTQNNLETALGDHYDPASFSFTRDNAEALRNTVEGKLGRACRFLFVSYEDRCDRDFANASGNGIRIARIAKDRSEWKGDDAAWRNILKDGFAER